MLGSKNTCKRGKYSLDLRLQHSNFQFWDIFEIGVTESVRSGFQACYTLRILVEDWRPDL